MGRKADYTLNNLLDLHGTVIDVGHGYWIKVEAQKVRPDTAKPHGVKYSLTLHDPNGKRILGYDNAHAIPNRSHIITHDHMHKEAKIVRYEYIDAEQLSLDFWNDVDRILKALD